ncbi:hypothetical protein FGADI_10298 [Fusarium gaditjirri]|uniref:Glycosyl hydrolase family 95 N-terminal domain-containing protein n=1 Tax=Fusarium gaditjirri TaxID=282569 RepID=A0A8H4SXH6_9HYPO|nr:hypothetical protein FGADI_10298 [Fusarium gaditjirri]
MHPLFLCVFVALTAPVGAQTGEYSGSRHLWYNSPGKDFKSSLPIGNGRLGALVQGSISEKIVINENSVWSGTFQDRVNPDALQGFPKARKFLTQNDYTGAAGTVSSTMYGKPTTNRWYSVTGNLLLDFGHQNEKYTNYERWLDTLGGNTGVSYLINGVTYTGSLNIGVSLQRDRGVLSNVAAGGANSIIIDVGGSGADAIPFTAGLRVVSDDGTIKAGGSALNITNASTVDLFLDVETSFQWASESQWKAGLANKLDKAVKRGFESLKSEAVSDHQNLMQRVALDLGSNNATSSLPTDKRVSAFGGHPNDDPEFVALSFQFGRHLLVSSSRDAGGTGLGVPANLQGIWNDMYNPPWGSKFTVNINTEMNYWLAETTDLTETLRPLWDLMYRSRDKGSDVATKMYGCPGYVSHHNLDLWGDSAPHDSGTPYTIWPSSNLQDIATFFNCYLFEFDGKWASGPSLSPENVFAIPKGSTTASLDISITMDNSLLREFFSNVIEAAGILGIDISTDKIQEWRQDYAEALQGHRHYSHLVDLFPARAMSPLLNQTLANAAQKSIELRLAGGGASTGWSRVWTAALYARLLDGDKAYGNIQTLLGRHPATNLFHNIEPGKPFQIDSNFGLVAAVAETLVQSQAGVVHILPALGSQVKTGSVSGLVARGGFQVSIVWKDGLLVEAKVKSRLGNSLEVRVANGLSFKIDGKAVNKVKTASGQTYTITLA